MNKEELLRNAFLYDEIEQTIIRWRLDGTRTAGSLTRDIIEIMNQYNQPEWNHPVPDNIMDSITFKSFKVSSFTGTLEDIIKEQIKQQGNEEQTND